mmetsp:Transcript_34142/g.81696  ORF Transcript_34142/g.81696 Transcript_34142/m.81696 type:complete len:246 (+) Transcript_34142:385-1122(+)
MGSACPGTFVIILSVRKKLVPNPTACSRARRSPTPIPPSAPAASPPPEPGFQSSSIPTPERQSAAASQVCGLLPTDTSFPSTSASSAGHTSTVAAPRKATFAGLVSTRLRLCEMYPTAVNVPQRRALAASSPSSLRRNGLSARLARSILAEVAALGGKESFIMLPSGKFVPYNTDANARSSRGPRYEPSIRSTSDWSPNGGIEVVTAPSPFDEPIVGTSSSKSGRTQTPLAQTTPRGLSGSKKSS